MNNEISRNGETVAFCVFGVATLCLSGIAIGIGFGSPKRHPRVTQGSPKRHARRRKGRIEELLCLQQSLKNDGWGGIGESGNPVIGKLRQCFTRDEMLESFVKDGNQQSYLPGYRQTGYWE